MMSKDNWGHWVKLWAVLALIESVMNEEIGQLMTLGP